MLSAVRLLFAGGGFFDGFFGFFAGHVAVAVGVELGVEFGEGFAGLLFGDAAVFVFVETLAEEAEGFFGQGYGLFGGGGGGGFADSQGGVLGGVDVFYVAEEHFVVRLFAPADGAGGIGIGWIAGAVVVNDVDF